MSVIDPPDRPPNPAFDNARSLEGPLSAQLAAYEATLRQRSPAVAEAYQRLVDHLRKVAVGRNAPTAGDPLPSFVLPDDRGRLVSSDALLEDGPLIVSFNRGNWCPFCWLELSALHTYYPAISRSGGSVISITPDIATFSRRLKRRLGLTFPVLTDLDNGYALELGLASALTEEVRQVYETAQIDLGAFQRSDGWFLPVPATLVVDRHGTIRYAYVNADFRERTEPRHLQEILAKL